MGAGGADPPGVHNEDQRKERGLQQKGRKGITKHLGGELPLRTLGRGKRGKET